MGIRDGLRVGYDVLRVAAGGGHALRAIAAPGSAGGTFGFGVNAGWAVTGYTIDASGADHGFIRDAQGDLTTLTVPGWSNISIPGVDDRGDIVGTDGDARGTLHSVHGQAVPEPGSLALMVAGIIGMAVLGTRRRA